MTDYTKPVNTQLTFQSTGIPAPTTNVWKIDGNIISGETGPNFTKSFNTKGIYQITHEGNITCPDSSVLSCSNPVTHSLEITDTTSQAGIGTFVIAGLLVGAIYLYLKNRNK